MRVFDLHCDTLYECDRTAQELYRNDLAVSLKGAERYERYVQAHAVWMPDDLRGDEALAHFDRLYDLYCRETEKNSGVMVKIKSGGDFDKLSDERPFGSVLTVEGGSACAGSIERLRYMYGLGVRIMTLTWNGENEIACGAKSDKDMGLSEFGRRVVKEMNALGLVIDVSHLNDRGFFEVASLSEKPFVATHSNARGVCGNKRNLTDEEISEIVRRGGLIGVNLFTEFLSCSGGADMDDVYAHISYMLERGCEDVLCLGCDFDGAETPDSLKKIENLENLAAYLSKKNIQNETVGKIFYDNAYGFLRRSL